MLTRLHLRGDRTRRGCAVLYVLAMALTGVLLTEAPGAAQSTSVERGRFSPQVYSADVGGVGTEMLGAPFTFQQATPTQPSTPTATPATPAPTPTPTPDPTTTPTTPSPTPAVAPTDEDKLPPTGAGALVLGTIGTWTLFLGMLLLHVATRRSERLRSLDGYL